MLQCHVAAASRREILVAAICYGVLLAARTVDPATGLAPDRVARFWDPDDGVYVSARWPGDTHTFAATVSAKLLGG
jgi:hypothetical protein